MSARFADAAVRLAGVAGVLLGWRPRDFWEATPAEIAAVLDALSGDAPPCAGSDELVRLREMFPDG